MPRFVSIQTNFSVGEIDPLVRARLDLQQYYNACEQGRNVLFLPQGGFRWRPGTRYIFELPDIGMAEPGAPPVDDEDSDFFGDRHFGTSYFGGRYFGSGAAAPPGAPSTATSTGVRLVPFQFSVDDSYMLCFVDRAMYVLKDGALVQDIAGVVGRPYLVTAIEPTNLADLNWTQSADTLILVQKDMAPKRVTRGATHADWTISDIVFDSVPRHAFTITTTTIAQPMTLSATSGRITVTAAGGTPFVAGNIGDYVNATPQGRARIVGVSSDSLVEAIVEVPFFAMAIAAGAWELETDYENVWSTPRGYPRSAVFHEGRLFFGGSKSRPSTVWGSKVGFPYAFYPDDGYADDAVESTIDSGRFNAVVDMLSGRDLQVFTTGGEYYVPQTTGSPITPETFFMKTATANGAKIGVRVQQLESGTLYLQREGRALQEFLYTDVELAYVSNKISLLSGHLLKRPKRMALRRATSTDEGDLLLITNEEDGSMGAWMLLRTQNVIAPSLWTTQGSFVDVAVDVTEIYAVTARTVGDSVRYYVEIFDLDLSTDAAFTGGNAAGATAPYSGLTVDLLLDGFVQEQTTVSGDGVVTFPRSSEDTYEFGLPWTPLVKTMPAEPRLASGARIGFKKRIPQVNVMVKDTQHLTVNGQEVPFSNFGSELLDQKIPEFTGTKRVGGLLGYSREQAITVSREAPLKATVVGIDYRVAVHGGT